MHLATKADDDCPRCGGSNVYEYTKSGETTRRLDCDDCGNEWSER